MQQIFRQAAVSIRGADMRRSAAVRSIRPLKKLVKDTRQRVILRKS